jgi:hypothetical protein
MDLQQMIEISKGSVIINVPVDNEDQALTTTIRGERRATLVVRMAVFSRAPIHASKVMIEQH